MGRLGHGGAHLLAQVQPDDTEATHEACDTLVVDVAAFTAQFGGDARAAVGAVELLVNLLDLLRERGIGRGACRPGGRGLEPSVKAGAR